MQKPDGYDSAEPKFDDGGFEQPPTGGHVLVIRDAEAAVSETSKKPMVILYLDIANGAFTNYFRAKSDKIGKNCLLRYYQLVAGNSLPYYKGLITSVEKSNDGFKYDHNEKSLIGKVVGGIIEANDKNYHKVARLCSVEKAIQVKQEPFPKFVKKPTSTGQISMIDSSSNINPPDPNREEVPW